MVDLSGSDHTVSSSGLIQPDVIHSGSEPYGSGATTATTLSTTQCSSDLTELDTDYWKDTFIRFTSGVLSGQVKLVTGYSMESGTLTFEAFTQAPSFGDTFILINS